MTASPLPIPHPERLPKAFRLKILLVWALLCAISVAVSIAKIRALSFPDPDDMLRLQQVRDWMAGQSWFDVRQYRMMPPEGVPMHWTRLIDPPIAATIALARPLVGQAAAEIVALVAIPLLTLGCVLALVMRFARRMFSGDAAILAGLVIGLSVPLQHQLRPMRIDHHGWQIVMALIALNAAFAQRARLGGAIAGLAMAFWMAISIEGLPMAAALMGLFALRWLRDPADREWLAWGMAALAGGSAVFWFASHPGNAVGEQLCDVVSGGHLAALAVAAAGTWLVTRLRFTSFWQRGLALVPVGVAALGALWATAPACMGADAFAALDPLVKEFWYMRVHEGLPIWHQRFPQAVQLLGIPLVGLLALLLAWRESSGAERRMWTDYALLLAAALLVAVMVERASAVAHTFAAPAAAWQVRKWLDRAQTIASPPRKIAAMVAALLALVPSLPILAVRSAIVPPELKLERQVRTGEKCQYASNLAGLDRLPAADILTPLDTGPSLIYATHHRIVASGHHRGEAGMHDVIRAFLSDSATAQAIAARRGIEYVAFCPRLFEPMIYKSMAPRGLMGQLMKGNVPDWLQPMRVPGVTGLRFYRVRTTDDPR